MWQWPRARQRTLPGSNLTDLNDVYISGEQEVSSDDSEDSQDPTEEAEEDAEFADAEFE